MNQENAPAAAIILRTRIPCGAPAAIRPFYRPAAAMETAAIAVKAEARLRGNVKQNSRPMGELESRIQNSESRIVTAALKATLKRHTLRGSCIPEADGSGGCFLALSDRAVWTAGPAAGRSRQPLSPQRQSGLESRPDFLCGLGTARQSRVMFKNHSHVSHPASSSASHDVAPHGPHPSCTSTS